MSIKELKSQLGEMTFTEATEVVLVARNACDLLGPKHPSYQTFFKMANDHQAYAKALYNVTHTDAKG